MESNPAVGFYESPPPLSTNRQRVNMQNDPEILQAALDYCARGWALTWIVPGEKFPKHRDWNTAAKAITTPEQTRATFGNGRRWSIGLIHALGAVRTCSLDCDRPDDARALLAEFGIEPEDLAGVPCVLGRNPRYVFRQPAGMDLPLVKLQWPDPNDASKKVVVFELRAGSNQDLLPPSLHPSGKHYEWRQPLPDDPADHPEPPPALLDLWQNWTAWEPVLQSACPWAKPATPQQAHRPKAVARSADVIGAFNQAHGVREILERNGYKPCGKARFLPPNSSSGVPSVRILDSGLVYSDNGSCPLADGHAHDAFDCFRILEHRGDWPRAIKAAAAELGMERPEPAPKSQRKARPAPDTDQPEIDRPVEIEIRAGLLPEMADQAEAVLMENDAAIFQRSGNLCRIARQQAATVRGIARPDGAVTIAALDVDFLLDRLNRAIHWQRYDRKQEALVSANAPRGVATALLARSGHWRFPVLISVLSAPTLRPDGSILDRPGYDSATGLFFEPQGVEFPPVPSHPSRDEARAALDLLVKEVLRRPCVNSDRAEDQGFSFSGKADRSAALAAILTGLVRQSLPTAPAFLFTATRPGSAKSLLADCVSLISTGRTATVFDLGEDADEIEKRLLAVLLAGDPVINLDNLEQPLGGSGLCKTLTAETITGRILGLSKNATVPTVTTWLATGNNVSVVGDMTRRTVICNLDPQSERPEGRQYDRNLKLWIPEHRARLAVAGLTVLRGFIAAGRPAQPYPPMGSFEEWDLIVRRPLTWLGEADPLAGTAKLEDADPIRQQLRAMLLAWHRAFKTAGATSREAIAAAGETVKDAEGNDVRPHQALYNVLVEYFTDRRGDLRSQLIGDFIRKHAGRVEIGARFDNVGSSQNAQIWRVKIVNQHRFQKFLDEGKQGHEGHRGHTESEKPDDPCDPGDPLHPRRENFAENDQGLEWNSKNGKWERPT